MCSVEARAASLVGSFGRKLPGVELQNLYGPTEAAVDVTAWNGSTAAAGASVPIGHPVANTRIYILDESGQPVPIGVPGEIFIGGVQVGRGYFARDELTAERFLPDSFVREPRSEEHTSEIQSLMRISYADLCLKKKNRYKNSTTIT